MADATNIIALLIAALALFVSYLSWRASAASVAASIFDRRFEIYLDAERFIGAWMREARPDMDQLPSLVAAWTRSHFLCSDEVTRYLRKLWLDAIQAAELREVMEGKAEGDHGKAVKESHALLLEHANYDNLRARFMDDLKVSPPQQFWRRS